MRTILATIVCSSMFCILAGVADAATVIQEYAVTEAFNDSNSKGFGDGHFLWLPELTGGSTFVLEPGMTGLLEHYDDNTVNLTAMVVSATDPNLKLNVDIWFENVRTFADLVAPEEAKQELENSAYVPPFGSGGPVDPATFLFYNVDSTRSTLTGKIGSDFEGLELSVFQFSDEFPGEEGFGANNKNIQYGMSDWIGYTVTQNTTGLTIADSSSHADINVNLTVVPVPAAAWTGISMLCGLGVVQKLRRKPLAIA